MAVKYKRARSRASTKNWAKAGIAAAGSTRASRARAAVVAAHRRLMRARSSKRRVVRGPRPGASASQSVGSSRFLTSQHSPPPEPALHKALGKLGIQVPQFTLFQSVERFHIQPASGRCYWGGVPYELKQGTVLATPASNTDYMPNNCDLFDCARKLVQGYTDNGLFYYTPFPTPKAPFTSLLDYGKNPATPPVDSNVSSIFGGSNHRRFKVARNKVAIFMENISSLDAFVEQYELVYKAPVQGNPLLATAQAAATTNQSYKLSIGANVSSTWASQEALTADDRNAPRVFNTYAGLPFYPEVFPEKLVTAYDIRRYGGRLAGQMLESYANIHLNHRDNQALMDMESSLVAARTAEVETFVKRPSIPEVLSHPLNDPTRIMGTGVLNRTGFTLRKLPGLITLKPGMSKRIYLPVKNEFTMDVDDFAKTSDREADFTFGLTNTAIYRDIATLPKSMKIRYFRVRGDMISDKTRLDSAGDADYQTGSCRVQFQVMRSLYMKHVVDMAAKVPTPIHEFDSVDVAPVNQEAINDENDLPSAIDHAGGP